MSARLPEQITHQKIVVVDDNPASLYSTSRILRSAGFEVLEASTGTEALAFAEQDVGLIVLDINLPDIDGLEVCRRLRLEQPRVPVVGVVLIRPQQEYGKRASTRSHTTWAAGRWPRHKMSIVRSTHGLTSTAPDCATPPRLSH